LFCFCVTAPICRRYRCLRPQTLADTKANLAGAVRTSGSSSSSSAAAAAAAEPAGLPQEAVDRITATGKALSQVWSFGEFPS
jgi:hypothetical protein